MRILCDHNVAQRYLDTFRRTDWITMIKADNVFPKDASDAEIGAYAEKHEWVVFTSDKRFRERDDEGTVGEDLLDRIEGCGVIYYRQREQPSPGDVVAAIEALAEAYANHSEIDQYVPNGWV
jgi:rRNA-processing protein FCF1